MDTRHELEYKKLVLRQRLESEVFELASDSLLPMPPSEQISPLISLSSNVGPITINLSQVSAQDNAAIQSIVGEVVQGDIVYTEEDGQLIELFNEYASRLEAIQLKSDLEQLKDQSAPQNVRLTAKQRIMGFLRKTAHVVGDAAVKIAVPKLIAYLNDLISGAPWS